MITQKKKKEIISKDIEREKKNIDLRKDPSFDSCILFKYVQNQYRKEFYGNFLKQYFTKIIKHSLLLVI